MPVVAKRNGHDRGYYIAMTESELAEGLRSLKKQQATTEKRIKLVQELDLKTWQKEWL